MNATTKTNTVTVRIPPKTGDDIQKEQLARIYHLLSGHIRSRHGLRAERQFRKAMDKMFITTGTTYEQLRSALESRMNLLLQEEQHELIWIATSTS
jgi:hypothetical protein